MQLDIKRIAKENRIRGWSNANLAKKLGKTRQSVDYIMKKKSTTLTTITRMAKIYKIKGKSLLT